MPLTSNFNPFQSPFSIDGSFPDTAVRPLTCKYLFICSENLGVFYSEFTL